MPYVTDDEHCTVTTNIVHVRKVDKRALEVFTSCHTAPVTLQFTAPALRDTYFKLLVDAVAKQP